MNPFVFFLSIGLLLLTGSLQAQPAASPQSDTPRFARRGPHGVGTRDFVIKEATEGLPLPATVWYPALIPPGQPAAHTYLVDTRKTATHSAGINAALPGRALVDATPDPAGKPYPLVIFSPGSDSSRLMYTPLLEHLASQGFAVVGVDHVPDIFTRRPKDVMGTLDFVAQGNLLPGLIDAQRVALIGHSVGAKTVMNVGGVSFSRAGGDPWDPRVKALVPMAMAESTVFMKAAEARSPILFWLGSQDKYRPVADLEEIYRAMPASRKALAVLRGAGHWPFVDPALAFLRPDWDWGSLDRKRAQDLIHHLTTAFLLDVLKGDPEARKALLPEAVTFEEIQYTTTWK